MKYLSHVTYSCIVVTHGASQRCGKSGTSQSCTWFAAAIRFSAGCGEKDGWRLLSFHTSSIPVSSTSRTIEAGCSGRGYEDCVHRKTFRSTRRTFAFIRGQKRLVTQRHGEPCSGGFSSTKEKAWMNDLQVGATGCNWNIGLIVCYRQNWNRFMDCWCPISDGRSTRQRFRRT